MVAIIQVIYAWKLATAQACCMIRMNVVLDAYSLFTLMKMMENRNKKTVQHSVSRTRSMNLLQSGALLTKRKEI